MESAIVVIISLTAYKIVSLMVGLLFSYMGYKLFMSGIWGHAGEIDSQFGDNKLVIKKVVPGTFFSLFGAIIVDMTIWKGLELKGLENMTTPTEPSIELHSQPTDALPEKPTNLGDKL